MQRISHSTLNRQLIDGLFNRIANLLQMCIIIKFDFTVRFTVPPLLVISLLDLLMFDMIERQVSDRSVEIGFHCTRNFPLSPALSKYFNNHLMLLLINSF